MVQAEHIVSRFSRAGLPLELARAPLARGQDAIVQLDIGRRAPRAERFLLWPGAEGNRVEALGIDRALRQVVLFVHEPVRRFVVEVGPFAVVPRAVRIVRREGRRRWIEQWTSAQKRHLLCGMDEAHLFIAALPRAVSTVRDAHAALRGPEIEQVDRDAPARTVRQGEWFFVALGSQEAAAVEALAVKHPARRKVGIAQAARLNRRGRQHVADEVLVVPFTPLDWRVYVRGGVRHPDHQTVRFSQWRRALGNAEPGVAPVGVTWVD